MAGYMNRFVDGSGVHLAPAEEELIAGTLSKPGSYANLSRLLARLTSESQAGLKPDTFCCGRPIEWGLAG
jgi:hypothetical protein